MSTQAERKRILADQLVGHAEARNKEQQNLINQHLKIASLPYGASLSQLFPLKQPLAYPRYSEALDLLMWSICIIVFPLLFVPFIVKKKRAEDKMAIDYENTGIAQSNARLQNEIDAILRGESQIMTSFINRTISQQSNDFLTTDIAVYISNDGKSASIAATVPNESQIPQSTFAARKTALDIIEKPKTKKVIHEEHSIIAHGTLLRIVANCLTYLPTIQSVDGAIFTNRRSKKTGQMEKECILYSIFDRGVWGRINFRHIDPIAVFDNFDCIRKPAKDGLLTRIEIDSGERR